MLRNRGVNVTERKIREDVLSAYEYDIFDVPRWRYMQELGFQANRYRQPRYCTVPRPVYYQTVRSSTNYGRASRKYGVRRVYLPENEWGASSADDSMMYIRNPRYNMGSYYPNEVFERPFSRERYPDCYHSRMASSTYMEDEEMETFQAPRYRTASYFPKRQTQLSRKVTRKLSPIFTCDCTTTANIEQPTSNDVDNDSPKTHHLSKEAKNLSLDICKILSLLQRDREHEDFSSRSLLQNVYDLECHNTNSAALRDICTQRVQIPSKLPKQKENPSEKFKAATGVRSKLEALLTALKQYEEEKMSNELGSSDIANDLNYKNVIPSDPPSLEVRSFSGEKDLQSSINIKGQQKDIVLQTEKPKTSNKYVTSKIKTKKDNMLVERKSLRSRLSWKKREATGINLRDYISNERLSEKMSVGEGLMKTKSKDRSRPEQLSEKNSAKQGQATNKAGFMIKIGGNPQRKKAKPPKEKHKDKLPKTWIKKFLDNTKDSKNNSLYMRWNNKAFNTKSSSTIFELVNNVYNQLGIKDYAKSDEVSVSDIKKVPKKKIHKSKTRIPRSSNKPKYKQNLKAYMMPQTIVPGPVYMPGNIMKTDKKFETEKVMSNTLMLHKSKRYLFELPFKNLLNSTSYPSSNYFKIHLPQDFFGPVPTTKDEQIIPSSDEQVCKIVEYETIQSTSITDDDDDLICDQKYDFNGTTNYLTNKHVYMVHGARSLRFPERSEDCEQNVIRREFESKPTDSFLQLQYDMDNDIASPSFPIKSCSLVDKIIEQEYLSWMPMPLSDYSLLGSDNYICSGGKVSTINDQDANINNLSVTLENVENEIQTNNHDYLESKVQNKMVSKKKFQRRNNHSVINNLDGWRDKANKTISESLIGIYSKKPGILSVYLNLFWELLKTSTRKSRTPPQDRLLQPPTIVSEPKCSYKPLNSSRPQQPLPQKLQILFEASRLVRSVPIFLQEKHSSAHYEPRHPIQFSLSSPTVLTTEKVRIPKNPLIVGKLPNPTQSSISVYALQFEKSKSAITYEPPVPVQFPNDRKPIQRMRFVRSTHNIPAENKMKFLFNCSVPFLQQHLRQFHLLASIHSLNSANAKQRLEQNCICNQLLVPQCQNNNQCKPISRESNLEDVELKSEDENRGQEEVTESSQIQNGTKKSADLITSCGKLEERGAKIKESSNDDDKEYQKTKTHNNKTKKIRNVKFVTHIPTIKNNVYSSVKPRIRLNKTESVQLSLKMKNGDKITKISIHNFDSNKVNNVKSINLTKCQEHVVDNRICSIEQSGNKISKNVKLLINITNINSAAKKRKNPVSVYITRDHVPKEAAVEYQKSTRIYPNLQQNLNGDLQSDQQNSVHKSLKSPSISKSHSQIDDMCLRKKLPIYVMEATRPNSLYGVGLHDLIANVETPRTEIYSKNIATKNNVKKLSNNNNTIDKIDPTKPVLEIKRMLNAMMMVKASDFAGMTVMNEISRKHNETYTTLSEQMLGRKEFVKIVSDLNMTKKKTDNKYQAKFFNGDESFGDLESGDSRSRCNVLTRKLTSHRRVEVDGNRPTNFNIKEKRHIAANYIMNIPHLANPVMQPHKTLKDFIFIGEDDVGIPSRIKKIKENKFQKGEPICWCCGKKVPRKIHTKECNTKENIKERVSETCKDGAIILTAMDPRKSQMSSFTEYKVILKNDDSCNIKDGDSKINRADILQSQIIKEAVLQIYSETDANEGYIVAKIPKYLQLPTS